MRMIQWVYLRILTGVWVDESLNLQSIQQKHSAHLHVIRSNIEILKSAA